ncbi:DUF6338 family protein [Acinetobacter ursingii]|uniref:DUF6338 family protein n=1 Tax=Acinetobacter ursingii TaxID=108980 RepID=UPI0021E2B76B|nr:DUF6338 family protein [Acinetobacter ursingii]UYF81101.1 DUF6338 family protein [Acinetobacter ursingii]
MEIFESSKLVLFIIFAIPGFISIKTYSLLCPNHEKDSTKLIIDAITYSCLNYALLGPFIYMMIFSKNGILFVLFYNYLLFICHARFSSIFSLGMVKVKKYGVFKRMLLILHQGHGLYFSQRKEYFVLVTLSDGKKLAGEYSEKSFTSSFPEDPQIYLEKAWEVSAEGGFERIREQSEGILILSKDIQSIEFFNIPNIYLWSYQCQLKI